MKRIAFLAVFVFLGSGSPRIMAEAPTPAQRDRASDVAPVVVPVSIVKTGSVDTARTVAWLKLKHKYELMVAEAVGHTAQAEKDLAGVYNVLGLREENLRLNDKLIERDERISRLQQANDELRQADAVSQKLIRHIKNNLTAADSQWQAAILITVLFLLGLAGFCVYLLTKNANLRGDLRQSQRIVRSFERQRDHKRSRDCEIGQGILPLMDAAVAQGMVGPPASVPEEPVADTSSDGDDLADAPDDPQAESVTVRHEAGLTVVDDGVVAMIVPSVQSPAASLETLFQPTEVEGAVAAIRPTPLTLDAVAAPSEAPLSAEEGPPLADEVRDLSGLQTVPAAPATEAPPESSSPEAAIDPDRTPAITMAFDAAPNAEAILASRRELRGEDDAETDPVGTKRA